MSAIDPQADCRCGSTAARVVRISSGTGAFTKGSDICHATEWTRSAESGPAFAALRRGCGRRREYYPSAGAQARAGTHWLQRQGEDFSLLSVFIKHQWRIQG